MPQMTYEQYVAERKKLDAAIINAENADFMARLTSERAEDWLNNPIDSLELWGER